VPNFVMLGLWGILLLEYLYIFLFPLNYDIAWMHPENFVTHAWILENGPQWQWEDFRRALHVDILEVDPHRLSRPISDFLEIVNTKFRVFLWNFIPPHPSLSIVWPLVLFGTPLCLYKFFRNFNCHTYVAFAGTCLYLSTIGFLVPLAMLFHPAKVLVNFLAVWCLWLGSHLYKKSITLKWQASVKDIPKYWIYYRLFLVSLFLSFFVDETGLFIYVMAALLLYPVVFRFKEWPISLGAFLILPVAYITTIKCLLPYIHFVVRGRVVDLNEFVLTPRISDLLSVETWNNHLTNLKWLLFDHPHMQLNTARKLTKTFAG